MEAAQLYLEAKSRAPVGSEPWAMATAWVFCLLRRKECVDAAKPDWWDDEGLKVLSARVVGAAPNKQSTLRMRAVVLSGLCGSAWEIGPRSAAELEEAATHFSRSAALCYAPAAKPELTSVAELCRFQAQRPCDPHFNQRIHLHFWCGSRANHLSDRVGSPGLTQ